MKDIYKSLKSKGNTQLFSYSDSNFFNSRIITTNTANFGIFDIDAKYVNYACSNDATNSKWFYLRQSEISDLKGKNLSVSDLKINKTIKFSSNQSVSVTSLAIEKLAGFPDAMITTIKKDTTKDDNNNNINNILINNKDGESSVYINSITNFNIFNPKDPDINITSNYLSISTNLNSVVSANTIDLTGTKTYKGEYKQNSSSVNLMGYTVSENKIIYRISKIDFLNPKYTLTVGKNFLIENPLNTPTTNAPNILNLTCGNAVKYVEYDANKNINCPDDVTNPTGIYIKRSDNGFIIYTPVLTEIASIEEA